MQHRLSKFASPETKALYYFHQYSQRHPDSTASYYNTAVLLVGRNDYKGALRSLRRVLAINPHHRRAMVDLGQLFSLLQSLTPLSLGGYSFLQDAIGFLIRTATLYFCFASQPQCTLVSGDTKKPNNRAIKFCPLTQRMSQSLIPWLPFIASE